MRWPEAVRTRNARAAWVLVCASALLGCPDRSQKSANQITPPPAQTSAQTPVPTPAPTVCPEPPAPIVVPCDAPEAGTVGTTATSEGDERLTLVAAGFDELPGWQDDSHADALRAFIRSCEKLATLKDRDRVGSSRFAGTARQWRRACKAAAKTAKTDPDDHAAARAYFEAHFRVYAAHGKSGPDGKITGYYVQPLRAAPTRGGSYQFPLFARPADLTSVQLSDFIGDGRSRRIWGYRDPRTGTLEPYPERETIRARAGVGPETEPKAGAVLLWVDDPADAIAVEIEGSGKATLPDGQVAWVAFAGKNGRRGRRSAAIMRALRELRARKLEKSDADNGSSSSNTWTDTDLEHFYTITDPRAAMVFFAIEPRAGAIGTQDVVLSAGRSLAVDRAVIGLSTPIWVSTKAPTSAKGKARPWHRLLIAQDTGGSILGTVRADIYFGDDDTARAIGRRVNGPGRMWLLLPRALNPDSRRE